MRIRPAGQDDLSELVRMSLALLPGSREEALRELVSLLRVDHAAVFVAERDVDPEAGAGSGFGDASGDDSVALSETAFEGPFGGRSEVLSGALSGGSSEEGLSAGQVAAQPRLAGYAEVVVRSYADGCGLDTPYLEAWYIDPDARRQGVGRALLSAVESWAQRRGADWLGSDCLLDNRTSASAHLASGFDEVDRVIQFRKRLKRPGPQDGSG